jgi:hypothetical protein
MIERETGDAIAKGIEQETFELKTKVWSFSAEMEKQVVRPRWSAPFNRSKGFQFLLSLANAEAIPQL